MTNKYLLKIAEKKDTNANLAVRLAVPIAAHQVLKQPLGYGLANHFSKKIDKRAPEYNHFIHKRTIAKTVRGNKLDVSLRGNPFGVKNKKPRVSDTFRGIDNAFLPSWQGGTRRGHVYATDRGKAMHELGHATADRLAGKHGPTRIGARTLGHHASKIVPLAMIASGDKDQARHAAGVSALAGGVVLADEAQANFHAYRAIAKHQTKAHANRYLRRFIAPQMGNYAAGYAIPVAAAGAAYKLLYNKKDKKNGNGQD